MPVALEIVSPERLLLSRDVDMVVVPGTDGDLGILPGHAMLVTSLRGGLVDIYEGNRVTDRFFVTGGFAEVTESRCSVLADEIIRQADIDVSEAQAKLLEAKAAFDAADVHDADAYREASDKLISAQAMVDSATV
ncbi:ATP synthase F1 subunit epsilon [Acidocella aminolytica]|jgi:F-type H+-transporting ATPase subunit epsilon|uniref:ATP synthase epsilon chain n=1 Tax=Acidocella aminolytica 101 = DSM 11237 TaxID=1120923 RepID=A0A0D6PI68_9PROT|nr:ATP synthase F1 subunit epsilon [Acidocella aminolytica]GAN80898.1 ATP synthase F1 subunit epsilon [Acidocella aminolytica 101 = DSM 11237]GBQ37423.1 ATP synthase F1 subunit epsilon [Acidocella aminolytica 101 = DSM 11237]SHF11993.1 ATP synthase F1 subcomplex epsilon subunit [Acidocella aminolytica 101 = DSM 11237]